MVARADAADGVGRFLAKNRESRAPERLVAVGHGAMRWCH